MRRFGLAVLAVSLVSACAGAPTGPEAPADPELKPSYIDLGLGDRVRCGDGITICSVLQVPAIEHANPNAHDAFDNHHHHP